VSVAVATFSGLDSAAIQVLRAKLEAIPEVESVIIDEAQGVIHLLCEPQTANSSVLKTAAEVVSSLGLSEDTVSVETVVRTSGTHRQRVRFIKAERTMDPDHRVRVRITLEWHGQVCTGESIGESGEYIELRTAALAALQAIEKVVGEPLDVKVVGVKQIRAFDSELMVVSMHRSGGTPQRLVGAVPGGRDPRESAAIAVLNGLNRTLGNYLNIG
jgi:hypothetical protein